MDYNIIELNKDDKAAALELLAASDLRMEDVLAEGTRYWGAYSGDKLIGVIGCEYQGGYGLLRTAFVQCEYRGIGIAAKLTETVFDAARRMGLKAVYLFSTDAGPYWLKQGFKIVPVDQVIEKLYDCYQVRLFDRLGWLPTEVTYKYNLG